MAIYTSIYKEILKDYDKLQTESKKDLIEKQSKIYKIIPQIKEIDTMLSLSGVKITKAILLNPNDSNVLIKNLKLKNDELINEKKRLLKENGFPDDYLTLKYKCSKCKDTGYIDNEICKCMKQKLIDKAYEQSNLKDILEKENFKTFNLAYYPDIKTQAEGISPKANIIKIINTCKRFIKEFDNSSSNLLFYGTTGLGKTFLCNCIAKEILDMGKTVLYLTAFQLFKMVETQKFNKNPDDDILKYLDYILDVDLLIIDDLGTEMGTIVTHSELYNLINLRLLNEKSTIISTNLSPTNLKDTYSERILSRIQGRYILLKFLGNDIRIQKKYEAIKGLK